MKTLISSNVKLTKDEECESLDSTKYRGMIAALITRRNGGRRRVVSVTQQPRSCKIDRALRECSRMHTTRLPSDKAQRLVNVTASLSINKSHRLRCQGVSFNETAPETSDASDIADIKDENHPRGTASSLQSAPVAGDSLLKVPHHVHDLWLQVQIFYDHVDCTTQMAIEYAAGGRLRRLRLEVAWETIENLAQYEEEG
ncbi:hypothetical protein Tco_0782296 [Tanacetum coccineum]